MPPENASKLWVKGTILKINMIDAVLLAQSVGIVEPSHGRLNMILKPHGVFLHPIIPLFPFLKMLSISFLFHWTFYHCCILHSSSAISLNGPDGHFYLSI